MSKEKQNFYELQSNGTIIWTLVSNFGTHEISLKAQGNIFETSKEAERERDRRILLTRFRQFRDKCNGDWKPNWKSDLKGSVNYFIERYYVDGKEEWCSEWYRRVNNFHLFGYFKNKEDCDRAIELFGDEIKRLYLEG